MDDLAVLSPLDVAIDPVESGVDDEVVTEEDSNNRKPLSEQDGQIQADDREMYQVTVTTTVPPVAQSSKRTPPRTAIRLEAAKRSHSALPAALRDSSVGQNAIAPTSHHEQHPQVHQLPPRVAMYPCLTPRTTQPEEEEGKVSSHQQPSILRPAYRMHIRANGQGLEPFLHKLLAVMAAFTSDSTMPSPSDSELQTEPALDEEEMEKDASLLQQQTSPPFETAPYPADTDSPGQADALGEKSIKPSLSQDETTSFRGKRDAFTISLQPSPSPQPAQSKLIGVRDLGDRV